MTRLNFGAARRSSWSSLNIHLPFPNRSSRTLSPGVRCQDRGSVSSRKASTTIGILALGTASGLSPLQPHVHQVGVCFPVNVLDPLRSLNLAPVHKCPQHRVQDCPEQ